MIARILALCIVAFLGAGLLLAAPAFSASTPTQLNVKDYGAVGDGKTDDTAAILKAVADGKAKNLPVCFPLEYRYVKADDIWLSMFEGRDGCSISVHQFGDVDYRPYFAEIEPIFWKYEGRPHWGKLHTLQAAELRELYPRWETFLAVRRRVDPHARFLNPYASTLLGVPA